MEELCINVDCPKRDESRISTNQTGPSSSERRFHGAVVLSLGLLSGFLLAALIGLSVHYHGSVHGLTAELATIKANLSERLQISDNKSSSLTEERDQLNARLTEITEERDRLQRLSRRNKTCPTGWRMFSCTCYFFSTESGSWEKGREDCRAKGADLVVIDSPEQRTFLAGLISKPTWIGLTDREEEGIWKWVDGTPLKLTYWEKNQPDNGGGDPQYGEEDCAHIRTLEDTNWNDLSCDSSLQWICEKMI
ncbi:CD209 antigen-like protein E [Trachinotus anak]|uniref:CD209 antigen-like protein E n=1 Tax=Trachinotus anak TaxID=443729 RepID=UPI0039F1B641